MGFCKPRSVNLETSVCKSLEVSLLSPCKAISNNKLLNLIYMYFLTSSGLVIVKRFASLLNLETSVCISLEVSVLSPCKAISNNKLLNLIYARHRSKQHSQVAHSLPKLALVQVIQQNLKSLNLSTINQKLT